MRFVEAVENVVIPLGRQGETNVETVQFPVDGWEELYGSGSFELIHKRCKDTAPYPCSITYDREAQVVNWVIASADTQYVGRGCAELVYVVNGAIAKSVIFATSVLKSIDGGSCAPEPWQSWVDEVLAAGAAAQEGESNAEAWAVGQRGGEDVSEDDETFHNNSKFYSEVAKQQALDAGFMAFYIDDNGDLIYQRTTNVEVSFRLIDGDLYVGVA